MKLPTVAVIIFVALIGFTIYSGSQTPVSQGVEPTNTTRIEVTRPVVLANTTNTTEVTRPECRVKTGIPAGTVNLRKGFGVTFGVITVLNEGDQVEYLGESVNGFMKVKLSDKVGWVRDVYLTCP